MEGQESADNPLPDALEFEGRFLSSWPITDNSFWWHHEQSSHDQQLPDFIPILNDNVASHQSQVSQARWNAERLNIDQSSSRRVGTYQGDSNNLNQTVGLERSVNEFITKDSLTNGVPSGQASTNQIATGSSSAHTSMNFRRTGMSFREENNRTTSGVITTHSSGKRKSPEGYQDQSSGMSSKRSCRIADSSSSHSGHIPSGSSSSHSGHIPSGSNSLPSSSAHIYRLDPLGTLSCGSVPSPRSSIFEIPFQQGTSSNQNIGESTNTSAQNLGHADILLPGPIINLNNNCIVQPPNLVTPPPQALGEGSNVLNQAMTAQSPVTYQRGVHFINGSRNVTRNSSRLNFAMGNAQMEEMGFRNSTQRLQFPVIAPPVGPSNLANIAVDFETSGGDASVAASTNLGTPSDPNLSVPTPNLNSNSQRRHRLERIRHVLREVFSYNSSITHTGPGGHSGISFETRQRLISQARRLITMHREERDISLLEEGVNARESLLSALGSIRDQHRDMRLDVDNMSYEELLELGDRIGDVKTGLSEESIMNILKCTKYTFIIKSNTPHAEPCSICRDEYSEGEDLGTLKCGHEYHTNCIKQWLLLKNSCPICKAAASSSSDK